MNDVFQDSEAELPDITKKNWASVASALKKNQEDMSSLRSELSNILNQIGSLVIRVEVLDQQSREAIGRRFDGGPTAE